MPSNFLISIWSYTAHSFVQVKSGRLPVHKRRQEFSERRHLHAHPSTYARLQPRINIIY